MSLDPAKIQRAVRHLRACDPVMRDLIPQAGKMVLKLHSNRFHALTSAILSQQISGKAAASIKRRLVERIAPEKISPDTLSRLTKEDLRIVGVSGQKATYLLDLAERVRSGQVRLDRMGRLSDEQVIESLVGIKGIGVWTAQMFLIFSLGRLDVFPHADYGIRSAMKKLYSLDELPDKDSSHRIAEPWRPYATVASWYCWRSLDLPKAKEKA
jgi:DNA-3-methyladenine glycosylase II